VLRTYQSFNSQAPLLANIGVCYITELATQRNNGRNYNLQNLPCLDSAICIFNLDDRTGRVMYGILTLTRLYVVTYKRTEILRNIYGMKYI
jgi:hypothetical protein